MKKYTEFSNNWNGTKDDLWTIMNLQINALQAAQPQLSKKEILAVLCEAMTRNVVTNEIAEMCDYIISETITRIPIHPSVNVGVDEHIMFQYKGWAVVCYYGDSGDGESGPMPYRSISVFDADGDVVEIYSTWDDTEIDWDIDVSAMLAISDAIENGYYVEDKVTGHMPGIRKGGK